MNDTQRENKMMSHASENKLRRMPLRPVTLMTKVREAKGLSRSHLAAQANLTYEQIEMVERYGAILDEAGQQRIAQALGHPGLFGPDGRAV